MDVPYGWTSEQGQATSLRRAQKDAHRNGAKSLVCPINTFYDGVTGGLTLDEVLLRNMENQRLRLSGQDSITKSVPLVLMNGITMSSSHPCCLLQSLYLIPTLSAQAPFMSVLGVREGLGLEKDSWLIHAQLTSREGTTHITLPSAVCAQASLGIHLIKS